MRLDKEGERAEKEDKKDAVKRDEPQRWKITLGDLSALAELKASMEAEEKPAKKATKKAKKTKNNHSF